MTMKTLVIIFVLFFIQPIFIAGLFYAWWNRKKRLAYVRETYRMNFNRTAFEISDYFFKALGGGVLLSALSFLLGIPLTIEWYMLYQLITIALLILSGSRLIHPLFTFSMTSISLFLMQKFGHKLPLNWLENLRDQKAVAIHFEANSINNLLLNSLLFIFLIVLITLFLMKDKDRNKLYPILRSSKRGKLVAKYQNKSLWLLPLVIVVPGAMIESIAPWWPLLSIGSKKYALLILPILLGFHFTISTQLIGEAVKHVKKELQMLAIFTGLLFLASYFYRPLTIWSLVIALGAGLLLLYRHRQRENLWAFKYGPADEGLRIIAVRPDSPADRMDLSMGMMITHINEVEMNSKNDFYNVITHNRSYIKIRLKRADGEIIMAEAALYDDDANNLGLLIL